LADVASSLIYPNTSTASYAIRSETATTASYARTASYISNFGASVDTASYSIKSGNADTSIVSNAAAALIFPNSSTASYAMKSENFSYNHFIDYGIFLATSQSISASQLDLVNVSSSLSGARQTDIRTVGTVIVPYTSSIVVNESLSLVIKNRDTGDEEIIDSTPIYFDVSRTVNLWDSLMSGTLKIPYVLEGSSSLLGNYMVFVTGSSSNIRIESTRTNRFNLASLSDTLTVSPAEELMFQMNPQGSSVLITFYTGSHEGPFTDYRNGMISSGSQTIESINVRSKNVNSIRYVWTLGNLNTLDCGDNDFITQLTGMPDTLVTLSCDSCSIDQMLSLANTTMSYFQCGKNELTSLPALPTSMSYLNCTNNNLTSIEGLPNTMSYLNASDNLIVSLPSSLPYGLTELYLNNNQIMSMDATLPNSILTMSISNNTGLFNWLGPLPTSLKRFYINDTILSSIPTLPPSMSYLNAASSSLSEPSINNICSQSIVNTQLNGFLYFNGLSISGSTYADYVTPLTMLYGWTVEYDSITP
jgi:hypothetical protein